MNFEPAPFIKGRTIAEVWPKALSCIVATAHWRQLCGEPHIVTDQRGELPYTEYRYTFLALRTLWRFAEYERDVHGWTWDVGVGFLLSNVLNPGNVISTPMIQAKIDKQQFIKVI